MIVVDVTAITRLSESIKHTATFKIRELHIDIEAIASRNFKLGRF